MSEIKLTPKQEKFANLYVELGNASEAYRQAFSCDKMSNETIHKRASELLNDGEVTGRVKQLQAETRKRADIRKDEAIELLANMVRANVLDYLEVNDNVELSLEDQLMGLAGQTITIKNLNSLTPEQQKCIKSITPVKGGIKLELYDKVQATDRLSKMLGWDEAVKQEVTLNDGGVNIDEWIKSRNK